MIGRTNLGTTRLGGITLARAVSEAGVGGVRKWWQQAAAPAIFASDLSEGAGVGYTTSGSNVASIIDLTGTGSSLLPATGLGAVGSVNGLDGLTFDGGATVRAYFGANPRVDELFNGASYLTFSLHHAAKHTTVPATAYAMSLTRNVGNDPGMWVIHTSAGLHNAQVFSTAGGNDSIVSGPVFVLNPGDTLVESQYVNGTTAKATTFLNGYINNLEATVTIAGHTWPLDFTRINVGNLSSTSSNNGLSGVFAGGAIFANAGHTLAEASRIHQEMLRRWHPAQLETVFEVFGYGQSNMAAAYTNTDPVSFTNGTAYAWLAAAPSQLTRTSVGHSTFGTNTSPAVWFAQELQRIIGGGVKPVIAVQGSGGIGLAGGGVNGSAAYLEPRTAAGDAAGATSGYTTNLPTRQIMRQVFDLTPRFDTEITRVMLWVGCETDVANMNALKVGGVVPPADLAAQQENIYRAMNATIDAFMADLGFTHFALCYTGRRGSDLATVQENAPIVAAINSALEQIASERSNVFIVYTANATFNASSFTQDDLAVDASGAWVSGAATIDGVHYSQAQYKAIGITGARNFATALGYSIPP